MEKIQGDLIQSSSNSSDHDYSPSNNEPNKKIVHQFYFVKLRSSFADPTLKIKIEKTKELRQQLIEDKLVILNEIDSIKGRIKRRDGYMWYWYGRCDGSYVHERRRYIQRLQQQLQSQWPQGSDSDIVPEPTPEPEPEPFNIDQKLMELNRRLVHGSRNISEERRILRELKEIQKRKEEPNNHVQTTKVQRLPWDPKQFLQRCIREEMKALRDREEQRREAAKRHEQTKAEIEEAVAPLERKLSEINQKKTRANEFILEGEKLLNQLTVYCDEFVTLLSNAKELAANKDLVALEQLSHKQVEEFIGRWKSNDEFRVNYMKSIIPALHSRELSSDGRTRNRGEKPMTY